MSNDNSGPQWPGPGGDSGSQNRYYARYQQASGEAITSPTKQSPGGGGGRRGLLVAIIAVVVAVAVVATVVISKVVGGDEDPANAAQASDAAQPSPSASNTPKLSWSNPSVAPTGARPLKAGWDAILAEKRLASAAYDVPKTNWTHEDGLLLGFVDSKGKTIVATGNSASYRAGFCKTAESADLAFVGFYGIGQSDPATAAPDVAKKFADAIALKKDNKSHARESKMTTKQTTVQSLPAVESIVVATNGDRNKKRCDAAKLEIRTMGVSMGSKSTMLVLVRAIDVPKALPEKEAEAILRTVRPASN